MNGNDKVSFSFGENWQEFIERSYDEARVNEAMKSLTDFLGIERLDGMSFLDIGCGSGLFSLAAWRLGARQVTSSDLDPLSVECCKLLRSKQGTPANWEVHSGSILDKSFISSLGKHDIVYSWGVLHHTGEMYRAIENSIEMVNPAGLLYIAIYNEVEGVLGSMSWLRLKRLYNRVPDFGKRFLEFFLIALIFAKMVINLKNPATEVNNYVSKRGMNFFTDIKDSLGGYPYEYAYASDIFNYCKSRDLNLLNLKTVSTLALNEFLFRKSQ